MIKAIALDDEPLPLGVLRKFAAQTGIIDLVATFTSPIQARDFIEANRVDLLFLDIQMPGISGIDFLASLSKDTLVIFTTAYSEYAVQGFNLKAVDYLLKPFEYERFLQGVERAEVLFQHKDRKTEEDHLFIRVDHGMVKVLLHDIRYIEGLNNYIKIYLADKQPLLIRMSMKEITEKLSGKGFIRVHRSYIVPMAGIVSVRNRMIYLGYMEIPVGINYVKSVQDLFSGK